MHCLRVQQLLTCFFNVFVCVQTIKQSPHSRQESVPRCRPRPLGFNKTISFIDSNCPTTDFTTVLFYSLCNKENPPIWDSRHDKKRLPRDPTCLTLITNLVQSLFILFCLLLWWFVASNVDNSQSIPNFFFDSRLVLILPFRFFNLIQSRLFCNFRVSF